MKPGTWIARPGSDVRHLLGLHYTGQWWKPTKTEGVVTWLGACSWGAITTREGPGNSPHVADEDMHLYRPCKRCVMILKDRTDYYREILEVAWNDVRAAEPTELVG